MKINHHLPCINIIFILLTVLCISSCKDHQAATSTSSASDYRKIDWTALMPPHWNAMDILKNYDLSKMQDDDPKTFELLKNVREQWNNAPVITTLDNKKVSITGYVAPLDGDATHVKEFLLVPYFGACIHSPPPPSNQVVHVYVNGNSPAFDNWEGSFTISGILKVSASDTGLGTAGYQMTADIVAPSKDSTP
jgi:uncharacterized protein